MAMNSQDLESTSQGEARRPYAAASNVIAALQRARTRNLPETIDDDYYRLVEIPDVVFGRVRQALEFIDMIHADGRPTDTLRSLAASTDEEYRELLASAIRNAFSDDFDRVDPGQDTQAQIVNAFRRYQPRSQTARMVMLFLGLCREAGIPVLEAPRERKMSGTSPRSVPPRANGGRQRPVPQRRNTPPAPQPLSPSGSIFGISEKDIALLDEEEFAEVWNALGKVARARARGLTKPAVQDDAASEDGGQI